MTPACDVREILARMRQGMCCNADADALEALLDKLVWKEFVENEYNVVRLCRHCNFPQGTRHAKWCPARGIDEEGCHGED